MRIRQYCLTHDSLWAYENMCETKAMEHERDGVIPSSGKCNFIEIEIMQTGRKRLHGD